MFHLNDFNINWVSFCMVLILSISLIFACNDLANISALIHVIKNSNPSNIGRLHLFSTQGCWGHPFYQLIAFIFHTGAGMDPAWSGRGGGGGGCSASSGAELCWSCAAHQLASLLQSLAWLLYLNCNCCSQFANYHHVITQITVSHFVSNNFLLYHEK
jgi:hypothetical protein